MTKRAIDTLAVARAIDEDPRETLGLEVAQELPLRIAVDDARVRWSGPTDR